MMATLLKRKPIPGASVDSDDLAPPGHAVAGAEVVTELPLERLDSDIAQDLDLQLEKLCLEEGSAPPEEVIAAGDEPTGSPIDSAVDVAGDKQSKLKSAFGEVKHFAGGWISHPFEATKKYSVLRHSHGLIFWQGPSTSVAITVFSDGPLPEDRQFWLQKRGFSGKIGLKIGTLGSRSAWINVTPAVTVKAESLLKDEERAWQRDIKKFLKKAASGKNIRNHQPCETNVVRVPHLADDGYFRIVLCAGREVLCPSPMFRVASSSTDPSLLRGASLTTLPLELGIRIGSLVAKHSANIAAHGTLAPALATYQSTVQPYMPSGLTQKAISTAYGVSGIEKRVDDKFQSAYDARMQADGQLAIADAVKDAQPVGDDDGPSTPFPLSFSGEVVRGTGLHSRMYGIPTANLADVPTDTLLRLSGVYAAWALFPKPKSSKSTVLPQDVYETWYQAVVIVAPDPNAKSQVVEQRVVGVYIINDFEDAKFFDAKLNLVLMAYLHPTASSGSESASEGQSLQLIADIATIEATLARPAWAAEFTLTRIKSAASERSFIERAADARQYGQKQISKVPLHKLGIRTEGQGFRDQLIGNGGYSVKR